MSLKDFKISSADSSNGLMLGEYSISENIHLQTIGYCGAGYNCSGGGGQCGAGYNCSGGGGQCGAGYNCSGS